MRTRTPIVASIAAGFSLLLIIGCSSGGSSTTPEAGPTPGPTGTDTDTGTDTGTGNSTTTGPLSGPRLFQTGNVVVSGTQENIAFGGFPIPPFTYTTDTAENVTGDGLPSNDTPDVLYDDQGRGIELRVTASSLPIVVTYNDDDSINTITKTRNSGSVSRITFNYEDGRLIGKSNTRTEIDGTEEYEGEASYTYDADGFLVSAEIVTVTFGIRVPDSFEFQTDAAGRVTRADRFDTDGDLERTYEMTYDANGNIVKVEIPDGLGGVAIRWNYVYGTSTEPTVNLIGFFAAINNAFIPEYDILVL